METKDSDKVLVDTSVWIEFFRRRHPYYEVLSDLIDEDRVVCTGVILAELLQGAKSIKEIDTLKEFLFVFDFLPESEKIWERAGVASFRLQRAGKSIGLSDCYIAAITKANNVKLFTLDRHFDVIKKEITFERYKIKR